MHGKKRSSKSTGERPVQHIKFTDCKCRVTIYEQSDLTWKITTCHLEHSGHQISRQAYYSNTHTKRLNANDFEYVKDLKKAKANNRNIASCLSNRTGKNYNAGEVRYIIKKVEEAEQSDKPPIEEVLTEVNNSGGNVMVHKDSKTKGVDVLWYQTKKMRDMVSTCKPRVFENDTTFGTQKQGYKVYVVIFFNNFTDKWEIAGLLFMSSESKDKVEIGLKFFKLSLPYTAETVGKFFFFCDKDWDYVELLEVIFWCIVFLCSIHCFRYFKDKVFNGKAFWENGEPLSHIKKAELLEQIKLVRDSPSEDLYIEREEKLLSLCEGLTVRAGSAINAVSFSSYYERNWKSMAFRWVYCYRKNLPLKGTNDTQAVESTIRAIKHYTKVEFGYVTPTMEQLITILPKILDKRSEERETVIGTRRIVIHHPNPVYKSALEEASWVLNAAGMRNFYKGILMADKRQKLITLENEILIEKYTGRKTRDYVGRYSSDGFSCNCSWFSSFLFCRHLIFYRVVKGLPIFDKIMFHPSFLSESQLNNETFDDIAENDFENTVVRNTGSPGMESLLDEEQAAERRKPKNTRFNDAYDVAKETAARLSRYNTKQFETILSSYKTFSNFIRDGFPEDLVQFLEQPDQFEIIPKVSLANMSVSSAISDSLSESRIQSEALPSTSIASPSLMSTATLSTSASSVSV